MRNAPVLFVSARLLCASCASPSSSAPAGRPLERLSQAVKGRLRDEEQLRSAGSHRSGIAVRGVYRYELELPSMFATSIFGHGVQNCVVCALGIFFVKRKK